MKPMWIVVCALMTVFNASASLITANLGYNSTNQLLVTKDTGLDNAVFTDVTRGSGVTADTRAGTSTAFDNAFTPDCDGSRGYFNWTLLGTKDLSDAISSGHYVEFALTLDAAEVSSLNSIMIRGVSATTSVNGFSLFVSTDGFASAPVAGNEIGSFNFTVASGTTSDAANPWTGYVTRTITPGSPLVLSGNTMYTFRLYINEDAAGEAKAMALDNISFDVTVIPEPATIGMLGIGSLLVLLIRRRIHF